jgi:hypothetical protein
MIKIKIAQEFSKRLVYSTEGNHNAIYFRQRYLDIDVIFASLDNKTRPIVEFNFEGVQIITPSFARTAFAYLLDYINIDYFNKLVKFKKIDKVLEMVIREEMEQYSKICE